MTTDSQPSPGEAHMGALTAADRKMWAEMREEFFMEGVNRASMEVMEKVCVGRCVCVCVCVGGYGQLVLWVSGCE